MKFFSERNLTIALISAIVLGIAIGFIAQMSKNPALISFIGEIQIFGRLFLRSLQMIVVPLVLFSVISGMANLHGAGEVRRKVFKVLAFFLLTSFFAVMVGMLYTNLIAPGAGGNAEDIRARLPETSIQSAQETQGAIALRAPETFTDFVSLQIDNIFQNPFRAMAETNLIGVVFFGLFLGFMLMQCGSQARVAIDVFNTINEALMKMVKVIIWIAPPGILALAANLAYNMGPDIIKPMGSYFITVVLALLTHLFVVYPLILKFVCGFSPVKFFKGIYEAQLFALSTSSSAATMPVTLRVVEEELGVDKRTADLVVPMGATVNMDGTALYEAIAAMFIAQLLGFELSIEKQLLIFFTATLAAIGAAGVPQAGLVTMVIVFNAIGLPLEYMALIIVVDRPLDHLRTVVNISGDATGAVFLASSEGEFANENSAAAEI